MLEGFGIFMACASTKLEVGPKGSYIKHGHHYCRERIRRR